MLRKEFLKLAENPPQGILPQVLAHLQMHKSKHELRSDNDEGAADYALRAIETCPSDDLWQTTRFDWRMELGDQLLQSEKFEKANEIHAAIDTEKLNRISATPIKASLPLAQRTSAKGSTRTRTPV